MTALVLILYVVMCFLVGNVARGYGRSFTTWTVFSILGSPITMAIVLEVAERRSSCDIA